MSERTHRRDFVRAVAVGGAAGSLAQPGRIAGDEPKNDAPKPASEIDARMNLILARYGKHLNEDGKKAVRAEMESIVRRAEALRKFVLTNGDEPFPVFRPYRAPLA